MYSMTTYREDFFDYVKSANRAVVPGLFVCVTVTLFSLLLTRGALWGGGFTLLPHDLFVDNPVFSLLTKIGPIVLALVICLFINYRLFDAGGRMPENISCASRLF